jgi:hypothetical protein
MSGYIRAGVQRARRVSQGQSRIIFVAPAAPPTPLHSLSDDFNDGSIDTTKWPANYGGIAEAGGRAQIDCDVLQFSGLKSGSIYTLDESYFFCQAFPAAGNTATIAYFSMLVTTTTPGTDAGFNIDTASSGIAFLSRVGFSDPGAVFDTYDPVNHAWLRLRETGGQLFWDTSADGVSWVNRRTSASPAWVTDINLAFLAEAHRDAGTDNISELDSFNTIAGTASAGVATFTVTANSSTNTIAPTSGVSLPVFVGNNSTTSIKASNGTNPSFSFTANNASVTVGTSAQAAVAGFTVTAQNTTTNVSPHADVATIGVTANNSTTKTSPQVGVATWSVVANNATDTEATHAGVGSFSFAANNATISTSKAIDAGVATIAFASNSGTTRIAPSVGVATFTLSAPTPSVITGAVAPANVAVATFTAQSATIRNSVSADNALIAMVAHDASTTVSTPVGCATLVFAANNATVTTVTVVNYESWGFSL